MSERAESSAGTFWGDAADADVVQRFRTLVNTVDDGIDQLDAEGRFVAVNDIIVEMSGYDRDELIGEHVSLVLSEADHQRIERTISSQLETDDVLGDVREDLQVKVEETDAEITTESFPRVNGGHGQLRQVIQSLLDNAIEYSGEDPPQIHVGAERVGDDWQISVSDDGTGIDPADADRIFQVFESLNTSGYSGTGIGLALCERIVERHGGEIWVDSQPGEGATFFFALPATGDGGE